jgi:hypothetical protein
VARRVVTSRSPGHRDSCYTPGLRHTDHSALVHLRLHQHLGDLRRFA